MPRSHKASKTRRNQPVSFDEAVAQTSSESQKTSPSSNRRFRYGLYVVWAAATILAGAGIGLWLSHGTDAVAVEPNPIATTDLTVSATSSSAEVVPQSATTQPTLSTSTGTAILQAQSGTPYASITAPVFQPGGGPNSLQPGYTAAGREQGNLGTPPAL